MNKKALIIESLIWLIILSLIAGIGAFCYNKFYVKPNIYVIKFSDIDGITKGSPVRLMGINIGYVRSLKSVSKHIDVEIIVTKRKVKIPEGTRANVVFYGLGGSKSIELMPPDGDCEVGILSGETIRLNDVANETKGLVEIIEMIEKYIKNLNQKGMEKFLNSIQEMKHQDINDMGDKFSSIEDSLVEKTEKIRQEQNEETKKIIKINEIVEKFNKFIKK